MKKLLLSLATMSFLNVAAADDAVQLQSGLLLDPATRSAVIMLPEGGIASVDIASGTTNWTSLATDKPLAIDNGRLVGQTQANLQGQLSLAYLGAGNGALINSVDLSLPENVIASVVDGPGRTFGMSLNSANQLRWDFIDQKAQGIAPSLDALSSPAAARNLPQVAAQSGLISLNFSAGSAEVNTQLDSLQPQQVSIERNVLSGVSGRQFISQDGQHVLVSERLPAGTKGRFQWRIYSIDGSLLGELSAAVSYAPFAVVEDQLLFVTPAGSALSTSSAQSNSELVERSRIVLRAINLRNGQQTWQQAIRDIRYTGPLPV